MPQTFNWAPEVKVCRLGAASAGDLLLDPGEALDEAAQHLLRFGAHPKQSPVVACRAVLKNLLKQGYVEECTTPMEYIGLR